MVDVLLTDQIVSATDVKRTGIAAFETDNGSPVAVTKNKRSEYYVLSAAL